MTPQALLSAKRNSVSLSLLAAVLLLSLIWIGLSFPRGFFRPTGYPPLGIFLQEPAPGAGFLNRRAFQCSDAQRNGQAAAWRPLVDSREVLLNCADSVYLNFVKEASHGGDLTLLNVGANKGYGLVQWLIEFDSTFNVTLEQVHSKYEELFPGVPRLCGVCQDCRETAHTVPLLPSVSGSLARDAVPTNSKPTIFAFEPAENNRLILEALSDLIQYPKLEVVQAAASNVSGEMYFTPCTPGQETCRLLTAYMEGAKTIQVTTVDKFLKERGVQHVDILKIDAEG
jgi:FkbM family methyltransferase